jgi:hypothetical protein
MPPLPVDFDPHMPLRRERHEHYARLRAILTPKLQAAREAGFETMTLGNIAKLDRRPDVRARVAALSKMDEEIISMKRERIEARLNAAAFGNVLQFATFDDETGEMVSIDWKRLAESDLAATITELGFDAKSGKLTRFGRDSALNAIAQLREMYGLKAAEKHLHGVKLSANVDLDQLSDEELCGLVKQLQSQFGPVINMVGRPDDGPHLEAQNGDSRRGEG